MLDYDYSHQSCALHNICIVFGIHSPALRCSISEYQIGIIAWRPVVRERGPWTHIDTDVSEMYIVTVVRVLDDDGDNVDDRDPKDADIRPTTYASSESKAVFFSSTSSSD